jgi:hypothetical protein
VIFSPTIGAKGPLMRFPINVFLSPSVLAELQQRAAARGVSRGQYLRELIEAVVAVPALSAEVSK